MGVGFRWQSKDTFFVLKLQKFEILRPPITIDVVQVQSADDLPTLFNIIFILLLLSASFYPLSTFHRLHDQEEVVVTRYAPCTNE